MHATLLLQMIDRVPFRQASEPSVGVTRLWGRVELRAARGGASLPPLSLAPGRSCKPVAVPFRPVVGLHVSLMQSSGLLWGSEDGN